MKADRMNYANEIEQLLADRPPGWDHSVRDRIQKFFADDTEGYARLMLPLMKAMAR